MKVTIITLFPEMISALHAGITGRALEQGLLQLETVNPRDFSTNKHQTVDDKPYGGGPGMVMQAEPLKRAIEHAKSTQPDAKIIYLSPQGTTFNHTAAVSMAVRDIIFIAGRYEGIDERIIEEYVDEEWSIGDYVLTGGELAAMVMVDAISRHIPGVVGDDQSVTSDSLANGLLKYPQYTRPEALDGKSVPKVLLSGHHDQIETWRKKASLGRTWRKRPDLLAKISLTEVEKALLNEFIEEEGIKNTRKMP